MAGIRTWVDCGTCGTHLDSGGIDFVRDEKRQPVVVEGHYQRRAFCMRCRTMQPFRSIKIRTRQGSARPACGSACLHGKRSCDCKCGGRCHGQERCQCGPAQQLALDGGS